MRNSYIDDKGYERFCDSGKLVHQTVAERKLGRKLKSWEVVHHRNRNKLDNRPVNLHVSRVRHADLRNNMDIENCGYSLGI